MRALAIVFVVLLGGCASLDHAGVARYTVRPMIVDGAPLCCEVEVVNGKQYAMLDALIEKRGGDYTVMLSERGVEAFDGQKVAAGAAKSATGTAAKAALAGAAVVALPAAGAALAAPGLGAAAAGAGALAVGQKLAD